MNELSTEQKAKRYDEAIIMAKECITYIPDEAVNKYMLNIFPELAESEDEKIRKELINLVKSHSEFYGNDWKIGDFTEEQVFDWLEKQGKLMKALQISNSRIAELVEEKYNLEEKLKKQGEQNTVPIDEVIKFLDENLINDTNEVTGEHFINFVNYGHFKETFISYFKRKMNEKQGEQKPIDNVEPKFKVGDVIRRKDGDGLEWTVEDVHKNGYYTIVNSDRDDFIYLDDNWELVEQKSADNAEYLIPRKGEYYVCIKDYYSINTNGQVYKSPCDGYINNNKGLGLSWTNSCTENYFRPIKEEDWIVCEQNNVIGNPLQYKEFMSESIQKNIKSLEDKGIVPNFRLWDISDAKDGDVLAYNDSKNNVWVCIFKEYANERVYDYCTLDKEGFWEHGNWNYLASFSYTPATKEQREQLEKAMADARYTFDFDKKELKKIEQKPAELGENRSKELSLSLQIQAYLNTASDELYAKGKPLYSEERVKDIHKCMLMWQKLHNAYFLYQKSAWSEEDENKVTLFMQLTEGCDNEEELADWLKSLKDRVGNFDDGYKVGFSVAKYNQWKPSDEQMNALAWILSFAKNCGEECAFELGQIQDQLKKLREE